MAKKRDKTTEASPVVAGWSRRAKLIASGFIVFHVAAVFMAPFRFSTTSGPGSPVSPAVQVTMPAVDWYVQAMFLDHGYAFFAPDPGPSHLVRYECTFDDGREPVTGTFPNLDDHWPRLLYHRHFMLSEQLNMDFMPTQPPPDFPGSPRDWERQREPYQKKWDAFEAHLKHVHDADRVTLTRVEHGLATDYDVLQGMQLNDPQLYRDLPETGPPAPLPPAMSPRVPLGPIAPELQP